MDLDHKATEDLARMAVWAQDSLEYAREHGQLTLIRLLEAIRVEVEFEDALFSVGRAPWLRTRALLQERGGHA